MTGLLTEVTPKEALEILRCFGAIKFTAEHRRYAGTIRALDATELYLLFKNTKGEFIIPKHMLIEFVCGDNVFEGIISHDGQKPQLQVFHIQPNGTRTAGEVAIRGSTALKSAFKNVHKTMPSSINGNGALCIFSEPGQALMAEAFKDQLAHRPDLVERANKTVFLHRKRTMDIETLSKRSRGNVPSETPEPHDVLGDDIAAGTTVDQAVVEDSEETPRRNGDQQEVTVDDFSQDDLSLDLYNCFQETWNIIQGESV